MSAIAAPVCKAGHEPGGQSLRRAHFVPMPNEDDPHVYYQCQRCTNCCRWPGDVQVSGEEVETIAAFLGMETGAFIDRYTRLRADRRGLSIIDRPDHSCIFLEGRDCVINEVKPQQCRDFPNKWRFPGWRQVCEAIAVPRVAE